MLWENTAGPKLVSRENSCRCMTTGLSSLTWAFAQLKLASRCPGSRGDLRWAAAVSFSPEPLLAEPPAEDLVDLLTPELLSLADYPILSPDLAVCPDEGYL